jgi:hypothetical protein
VREAIYGRLSGDATLMATLSGGLHTQSEISRQLTPAAFDANGEILPCGLLKLETQSPWGPFAHSSRLYFSVMLYQRAGYEAIETARTRLYQLLHEQKATPASGGCWEIRHSGDVLDAEDGALGCSLAVSRFVATVGRA